MRTQIVDPAAFHFGGDKTYRDYVTHCKVCNQAVLKTQSWKWASKPTGISHTECLETDASPRHT